MVKVAIYGWNDRHKAKIIDQLDEYIEITELPVKIDLDLGLDQLAFFESSIQFDPVLTEEERILMAHRLIVAREDFVMPSYDLEFWYPGPVNEVGIERVYVTLLEDYGLDVSVVRLPRDRDLAADHVRAQIERKLFDHDGATRAEA